MPDMEQIELDGVVYDVRDPTKAPAGYGLGEDSKYLAASDDLNNITQNGWYYWHANMPVNSGTVYSCMHVSSANGFIVQHIFAFSSRVEYIRISDGSEWSMEWVNPPMTVGVEYRTTERYQGKAVYTQLFEFGALPNKTDKSCTLPTATKATDMVRYEGKMKYGDRRYDLRGVNGIAIAFLNCSPTSNAYFWITTNEDMSAYTATIQVWYTRD